MYYVIVTYIYLNKLNLMRQKTQRRNIETPQLQKIISGINKIQQTLHTQEYLFASQNCPCLICKSKRKVVKKQKLFQQGSLESDKWLLKILSGLANRDAPGIKIYVPDISFIEADTLKIFYTDSKDGTIKKMDGTTPTKNLFHVMLRLKKLYKEMLEQKFQRQILNQINPQFVHEKYMEHILPSFFVEGEESFNLQKNKNEFVKYVFHKDQKFLIQSIQQHKLNENQPFCSVRFTDGNMQLFSKKQFEIFTLLKVPNDIIYTQSFIKQKQEQKSHYTSQYSFYSKQLDQQLFNKAEVQILIMIGGIGKYNQNFQDLQNFQDFTLQLMKSDIDAYIKYMTYKIVHYLAMVSRIYVKHIKIDWILNDLNMVYMQNVFQFQTTQICLRSLKYRLPPKQQNLVFYKDSQNFINLYKQVQIMRENKRLSIRKKIIEQRSKQKLQTQRSLRMEQRSTINDSEILSKHNGKKLSPIKNHKNKVSLMSISKTISTAPHNSISKQHAHFRSKILDDRYLNKQIKLTEAQKQKKRRFMSVLDKYII